MTHLLFALAAVAGCAIGTVVGALGGGGAILTVPLLVYGFGLSPTAASTGSLVVVGISSFVACGSYAKRGQVRWRDGLIFGALGIIGAYAGALISADLNPRALMGSFGVLLLIVAALMWVRADHQLSPSHTHAAAASDKPAQDTATASAGAVEPAYRPSVWAVAMAAIAVGALTGVFGVGGGFAVVPALTMLLSLPIRVATGTSLFVVGLNAASALPLRLAHGLDTDWALVAVVTPFAVIGSLVGARVARSVPTHVLTRAFAVLLLGVACYVGMRSAAG